MFESSLGPLYWFTQIAGIFFIIGMWGGFVIGIIALMKKPQKKWKPILAIILPVVYNLLTFFVVRFLSLILFKF